MERHNVKQLAAIIINCSKDGDGGNQQMLASAIAALEKKQDIAKKADYNCQHKKWQPYFVQNL